jgi:hypothetical protein
MSGEDPKAEQYTVKSGDTPESIAKKYNISVWDLAKWNPGKQEGGGVFNSIEGKSYSQYWQKGAGEEWKLRPGDKLDLVPQKIHYFFEELTPDIYRFTSECLKKNPSHKILTYNGGGKAASKNRYAAVGNLPSCHQQGLWSHSKDEFPYASCIEGGKGASVQCVPIEQQSIQGGQLSNLSRGLNAGDKFVVVLIPGKNRPSPEPEPYLVPSMQPKAHPTPPLFPVITVANPNSVPKLVPGLLVPLLILPIFIIDPNIIMESPNTERPQG